MPALTNLACNICALLLPALIYAAGISQCQAHAVFGSEFEIDGQTLLTDHQLPHTYYLVPPSPSIALDDNGRPAIFLSLTHYTGTELRGDVGQNQVNWSLLVELERNSISQQQRAAIIEALQRASSDIDAVSLRDLPISSVPTSITYQGIDTPEQNIRLDTANVVEGNGAATGLQGYHSVYWTRRNLSFALSPADGIAMRAAFDAGGSIMSVSTNYLARGIKLDHDDTGQLSYTPLEKVIAPSAFRVQINQSQHPDYLRVIDLNSISPPGYVGLTLLCYDFTGDPAIAALSLKKVELEAEGVTGRTIKTTLQFQRDPQGISQRYARFPFAVRVDRPFRYRTKSYNNDGALKVSEWTRVENWVVPLDITSYPENQQDRAQTPSITQDLI